MKRNPGFHQLLGERALLEVDPAASVEPFNDLAAADILPTTS